MGFTATIMSKEEAMALPLSERPICFRISSKMYHAIWQEIGAASMCWKQPPPMEECNHAALEKCAIDLCFSVAEELESRNSLENIGTALESPAYDEEEYSGPWEKTLYNDHSHRGICFLHLRRMDEFGLGFMTGRVDYSDSGIGKHLYSFRVHLLIIKLELCWII